MFMFLGHGQPIGENQKYPTFKYQATNANLKWIIMDKAFDGLTTCISPIATINQSSILVYCPLALVPLERLFSFLIFSGKCLFKLPQECSEYICCT